MLTSTRYARYLKIEQGIAISRRIRQRFAALSSSAKNEDDGNVNESPSSTRRPSATQRLPFHRKLPTTKEPDKDISDIVSNYFANSPSRTKTGPPRRFPSLSSSVSSSSASTSTKERGSALKELRTNRLDRGSESFSRFSRDRDLSKIRPGSLREKFLPGTKDKPEGVQSILKTVPTSSSAFSPTSKDTEKSESDSRPKDPTDVSLLRDALFGETNSKGRNDSKDSTTALSAIIESMRAMREVKRQEDNQQSSFSGTAKWRATAGVRRRRDEDVATNQAIRDSTSRLEQRVRQRTGKALGRDSHSSKVVRLPSHEMNLNEVSQLLRVSTRDLRKSLRSIGELPSGKVEDEEIILQTEVVEYIALDLGIDFERSDNSIQSDEDLLLQRRALAEKAEDSYESFPPRPPVVTIMGHVDHGKTTLMDALRRRAAGDGSGKKEKKKDKKKKNKNAAATKKNKDDDVAGTEAGGITQVISAFQVPLADADVDAVTFLDTPGHAAFRAMRQSGSDAADVIVLVVAADDGVSPQTVEIIEFYKSIIKSSGGGISMLVALNKIDKPGIDVQAARTKLEGQLLEHGIVPEGMGTESEFGPPVQLIPVSGLTGEGLDELIGGLVLQSEIMDLRADKDARAEGVVLDARVEKGLGVVADCIIRWGSIAKGDVVVSGVQIGKVRILRDVNDKMLKQGSPSQPIRIVGFEEIPKAGDPFVCMESEEEANELVERRKVAQETEAIVNATVSNNSKAELQSAGKHLMSYDWRERLQAKHGIDSSDDGSPTRIPVILRADGEGSLAALKESLVLMGKESTHNVIIDPIQVGIGPALPADVEIAKESHAAIVCFNVKNDAAKEADRASVHVLRSDVIYSILDEARKYFGTYLPATPVEKFHGRAKVGAVFSIGGLETQVAGLQIQDGTLYRDKVPSGKTTRGPSLTALYRVIRDGKVLEETAKGLPSTSLKHYKEDVVEIGRGKECGLSLADFNGFEEGDIVECWSISMEHQSL